MALKRSINNKNGIFSIISAYLGHDPCVGFNPHTIENRMCGSRSHWIAARHCFCSPLLLLRIQNRIVCECFCLFATDASQVSNNNAKQTFSIRLSPLFLLHKCDVIEPHLIALYKQMPLTHNWRMKMRLAVCVSIRIENDNSRYYSHEKFVLRFPDFLFRIILLAELFLLFFRTQKNTDFPEMLISPRKTPQAKRMSRRQYRNAHAHTRENTYYDDKKWMIEMDRRCLGIKY